MTLYVADDALFESTHVCKSKAMANGIIIETTRANDLPLNNPLGMCHTFVLAVQEERFELSKCKILVSFQHYSKQKTLFESTV